MHPNSPTACSNTTQAVATAASTGSLASGTTVAPGFAFSAYRTLVENFPQPIFLKDDQSRIVFINKAMTTAFGSDAKKVVGRSDIDVFGRPLNTACRNDDATVIGEGRSLTKEEVLNLNGGDRVIEVTKLPVRDDSGKVIGIAGYVNDVTEHRHEHASRRKSEEQFHRVWEKCLDGMRLTDEDGLIVRVNPAFCRMVGKTQEELVGKAFSVIYETAQPEGILVKHRKRFAERNVEPLFERELLLWNGAKVWFELSNSFIEVEGQKPQLLSMFRDISERKNAEEKVREFTERLERSNRELQDFAYVASHDLQEPLRKVSVFGDRLKAKYGAALGTEGCDYLDRMQKAALRMQILIQDLLTFSRVTSKSQPFVPVDLNKVASEVISDLESRIEQVAGKVEVSTLPTIDAEPLHMRQLLQNLIGNALKFHRADVKPVVRIDSYTFREYNPLAPNGTREMIQLSVSDNGIGFDEKYVEKIFQVFQRLHSRAEYEGTGMGLAITRKIVEHHCGQITAKSKPGEGATFVVILPVQHHKPESNV